MLKQVPKMIGSDAEFSNHIAGRSGDSCPEAVGMLLAAIPGVPATSFPSQYARYGEPPT